MFRHLTIVLSSITLFAFSISSHSTDTTAQETKETKTVLTTLEPGEFSMIQFLNACPAVANATPSKRIQPEIVGAVFRHNGQQYEVRVQSFEDTKGVLPATMTFKEYIAQNNLNNITSHIVHPLPVLSFESFDFRHAKLGDGVYFTIVVRKIEE